MPAAVQCAVVFFIRCFFYQNTVLQTVNPRTDEPVTVKIDLKYRMELSQCLQLYNVLFLRVMKELKMTLVGRSYYLPGEKFLVPQYK